MLRNNLQRIKLDQEHKFITGEEGDSVSVINDPNVVSLLKELLEDYESGKIVSLKENALGPNENRTELAAKAIKVLMTEHGIRVLEDQKYLDMARVLLDTVDSF